MSVTRLYHPGNLQCGETVPLTAEASNHLIRVLRTRVKSPVILFNGDGYDYYCTTLNNDTRKTRVVVDSKTANHSESKLTVTLFQGLSRQHRMEFTIQKSVELGVSRIVPIICSRSNMKLTKDQQKKKLDHWQRVAISACEQSGRSVIPDITEIISVDNLGPMLSIKALKLVLNPEKGLSLNHIHDSHSSAEINNIEVCIGPEGGLTKEEVAYFEEYQFTNIRFGPRILRTETAGPAVISAFQVLWGDC